MNYLLLLLFIGIGVLVFWIQARLERKRVAALEIWAAKEGWSFDPDEVGNPSYDYELFDQGHSRYLRHAMEKTFTATTPGLEDVHLRLFEYHYAVTHSTGKSTHTEHYLFTCALIDPGLDLGRVELRREGLGDKLLQAIGFDDIDFEDAEFSRRYVVKAKDRKAAYDLFDGQMMRFLCTSEAPHLETHERQLFLYRDGESTPAGFASLAAFSLAFLAQLPRPLVNAERARRDLPPVMEAGNASSSSRRALEQLEGKNP